MTAVEKAGRVVITIIKVLTVVLLLYFFICSIDLLGSSFELIGGKQPPRGLLVKKTTYKYTIKIKI